MRRVPPQVRPGTLSPTDAAAINEAFRDLYALLGSITGQGGVTVGRSRGGLVIGVNPSADDPVFGASGPSHAAGDVPDPGGTAGTAKFLREDATWAVPAGGGSLIVDNEAGTVTVNPATAVQVNDTLGTTSQTALNLRDPGTGTAVVSCLYAAPGQDGVLSTADQLLPAGIKAFVKIGLQGTAGSSGGTDPVFSVVTGSYTPLKASGTVAQAKFANRTTGVGANYASLAVGDLYLGDITSDSVALCSNNGTPSTLFFMQSGFSVLVLAPGAGTYASGSTSNYLSYCGQIVANGFTARIGGVNFAGATGTTSEGDTVKGGLITTIAISDARFKDTEGPLEGGLGVVEAVRPVRYRWRDGREPGGQVGFLAQELAAALPQLVRGHDDGTLGLNLPAIVAVLWQAVRELAGRP